VSTARDRKSTSNEAIRIVPELEKYVPTLTDNVSIAAQGDPPAPDGFLLQAS
jgi:hypothetical protein